MYVMGNKSNYDWLMESKVQLENGMVSAHMLKRIHFKCLKYMDFLLLPQAIIIRPGVFFKLW